MSDTELNPEADSVEEVVEEVTEESSESVLEDAVEVVEEAEVEVAEDVVEEVVVEEAAAKEAAPVEEAPIEEAAVEEAPAEEAVEEEAAEEAPVEEVPAEEAPAAAAPADEDAAGDVADEDELFEEEAPVRVQSAFDRPGRWYVVHTQSGHEKKAQQNLKARAASMNMEDRIFESVIPMEDVVEFKNGKKVVVQKKMFPGYLLVRAHLDDDAWYVVRNTPSIVNFVGSGGKPSPLIRREVENFLQVKEEGAPATPNTKRKTARLEYEMGETVRVKEGPFADFSGEIVEINEDQLKVKVLVNIFGRETPVELEFSQIARL